MLPQIDWKGDCPPCWERLDKLGWTTGLAFDAYGVRLGVRVNDASVLERIAKLLPPGWKALDSPLVEGLYSLKVAEPSLNKCVKRYHVLYQGVGRIARTLDLDEALEILESDLHTQVAAQSKTRLFVHAGVVAIGGQAVLIPGRSFSGKTSLVAALVRAGAIYYSDEYAVLDTDGRVYPYARPLALRDGAGQPLGQVTAESLGGVAGTEPLPVSLVVGAEYKAGSRWRPRVLTPGETLMLLLDNTVQVRSQPQLAMETLHKVALEACAVKSKRGEAQQVASWIFAKK
jgi:hypothetical protein